VAPLTDAGPGEAVGDRARRLYVGQSRIDITRRASTERITSDASLARAVATALLAAGAPMPASVALVLTDDEELGELNRAHLGKRGPTDVLSFPMLTTGSYPPHPGQPATVAADASASLGPPRRPGRGRAPRTHVGDIAISVERAVEQARTGHGGQTGDVRWSPADELRLLATHGTLHLCGWDHAERDEEAAMRALERTLLAVGARRP